MKEKKVSLSVLIVCVVLSLVLSAGAVLAFVPNAVKGYLTGSDSLTKYMEIEALIDKYFVEDVSDGDLADGIALGAVYALDDAYCAYYTAEEYSRVLDSNEGLDAGIGVNVSEHPDNGYIYVISVSTGSPAETAGITAGDIITKVDGKDAAELGFSEAVAAVRGEVDTKCELTVERDGKELVTEVTRGRYVSTSIYYHMIDSLCYIKITDFNTATVAQFEDALAAADDNGATGLIFDVRRNTGGTLDSVEKMLDVLLPEGDVVSATYKNGEKKVLFTSDKRSVDLPMAVLTDGQTASAAELFAAAIRDFDKGTLIGTKTYGKGVMQRSFGLSDGSAVRLTVAYFNPPSGVNFHGKGIDPDIEVVLSDEESEYFYFLTDDTDPVIKEAVKQLDEH